MASIGDLITGALTEIRVARAGDVVNPEDMALGLYQCNRLLDEWNADRRAVYSENFADFTLTPALNPHTIGPAGVFNTGATSTRPVSIEFISINLGTAAAPIFVPVTMRGDEWYANQPVPAMTNSVPTDAVYSPDWPLGNIYFFGVPTTAYRVRIWSRVLLAAVAQTDTFSLPPGYQTALELTLAENLAPSFGQSVAASTSKRANDARARIFGNNDSVPNLMTRDAGMPGGGSGSGFNWKARKVG